MKQEFYLLEDQFNLNTYGKFFFPLSKISQDQAQSNTSIFSSIIDAVKNYISQHFDNNKSKAANVINFLAPGVISLIIPGPIGKIAALLLSVFHVHISDIFSSLSSSFIPSVQNNEQLSYQQVRDKVNSTVDQSLNSEQQAATSSFYNIFHKEAKSSSIFIASPLKSLFTLIISLLLASGGFMIAGDIANKILHRPNAFDQTLKNNQAPVQQELQATQTIFPLSPNYEDNHPIPWSVNISNDKSSIKNFVLDLVKEVYPTMATHQDIIQNTLGFNYITNYISQYNVNAEGDNFILIPPILHSKKEIVDFFADQVAKEYQKQNPTNNNNNIIPNNNDAIKQDNNPPLVQT